MVAINYVWDELSDNVILEVDDSGTTTAEYTNEPSLYGERISQRQDSADNYFHIDAQRSIRQLTSENETVTDSYSYTAFGEPVATSGTTENPFRYNGSVGYYTDTETGEIYIRRRTYRPEIARWLSRDPLDFVDGPDLYAYVNNHPEDADPSGRAIAKTGYPTLIKASWPRCPEGWDFIYAVPFEVGSSHEYKPLPNTTWVQRKNTRGIRWAYWTFPNTTPGRLRPGVKIIKFSPPVTLRIAWDHVEPLAFKSGADPDLRSNLTIFDTRRVGVCNQGLDTTFEFELNDPIDYAVLYSRKNKWGRLIGDVYWDPVPGWWQIGRVGSFVKPERNIKVIVKEQSRLGEQLMTIFVIQDEAITADRKYVYGMPAQWWRSAGYFLCSRQCSLCQIKDW